MAIINNIIPKSFDILFDNNNNVTIAIGINIQYSFNTCISCEKVKSNESIKPIHNL